MFLKWLAEPCSDNDGLIGICMGLWFPQSFLFPYQVSLENLLDFLVLCESSGFIEFKLSLEDLREKVRVFFY